MNIYLEDLKEAINEVKGNYYSQFAIQYVTDEGEIGKLKRQEIERVFSYELFYQWRKTIEREEKTRYKGLRLHGEVSKPHLLHLQDKIEFDNFGMINYSPNKYSFVPDLVLHKGQESIEYKDQEMVIEIKTDKIPATNDLAKLLNLVDKYNFQTGVFVTINNSIKELEANILNSFNKEQLALKLKTHEDTFKRILILNKASSSSKLVELNLFDFLIANL